MTSTATEQQFTVGQDFHRDPDLVEALPIGTKIRGSNTGAIWERTDEDTWTLIEPNGSISPVGHEKASPQFTGRYFIEHLPSDLPPVWATLTSAEMVEALPEGTRIASRSTGAKFIRVENGRVDAIRGRDWTGERMNLNHPASAFTGGSYYIHAYPEQEAQPEPRTYTVTELRGLPVGTVVRSSNGRTWRRDQDHMVMLTLRTDGGENTWRVRHQWAPWNGGVESNGGIYTIVTEPEAQPEPEQSSVLNPVEGVEITLPTETLVQFQQRFRTEIEGGAQADSIDSGRVEAALTKVGVPDTSISAGMVVNSSDQSMLRALPEGTTITYGADFSDESKFRSVTVENDGSTRRILGTLAFDRATGVVDHIPNQEHQPWVDERPTAADRADIRTFKANVWRLGERIKEDLQLCRQYERAMAVCGIHAAEIDLPPEAHDLLAHEVADLPAGSVLRYRTKWGTVLLLRDDRATNPARTIHLAGGIPGDWVTSGMTLVHRGGGDMHIMLESVAEMEELPEGTKIRGIFDGECRYTRRDNSGTNYKWALEGESNAYYDHTSLRLGTYEIIELGSVLNQEGQ